MAAGGAYKEGSSGIAGQTKMRGEKLWEMICPVKWNRLKWIGE